MKWIKTYLFLGRLCWHNLLNIFCFLKAMTGWDYHSGWSHPVYDGFVVCDEHVETLMDAWQVSCLKYVGLILSKIFFIWKKKCLKCNLIVFCFLRWLTKNKNNVNERSERNVFTITGEDWSEVCSSENAYKQNTSEMLLKTISLQSLTVLKVKSV